MCKVIGQDWLDYYVSHLRDKHAAIVPDRLRDHAHREYANPSYDIVERVFK